jgi:hypothetical protein
VHGQTSPVLRAHGNPESETPEYGDRGGPKTGIDEPSVSERPVAEGRADIGGRR